MTLRRRDFLKTGAAFSVAATLPNGGALAQTFAPRPGPWRTFQIVTRLEIANPEGKVQVWIPLPAVNESEWTRPLGNEWTTKGHASLVREPKYRAELLHVEFAQGATAPVVEVTSRFQTR